jgi:peptidoglycan hydrolase-like protein with peptidoglycan-binding domain
MLGSASSGSGRRRGRLIALVGGALFAVLGALALTVWHLAGASIGNDPEGLAHLSLGSFGGSYVHGYVVTATGKHVALVRTGDVLTPAAQLAAGQQVQVVATVKSPGALAWALGKERRLRMSVKTPDAVVDSRWVFAQADGTVPVTFTSKVSRVSYVVKHQPSVRKLATPAKTFSLGKPGPAGSLRIAAGARPWLRLSKLTTVNWFPKTSGAFAIVSPKPGGQRGPADPIRLTFATPVDQALGSKRPTLSPSVPGKWSQPDDHTLLFTPTGYGAGFGTTVHVGLPREVEVTGADGAADVKTRDLSFTSSPGSTLRLQQLLADAGYLPLKWVPAGAPVARTRAAEARAASKAPKGVFEWRYPNTPKELKAQWTNGKVDTITRGAIMMFQNEHGLAADAVPGATVWRALLDNAIKGHRHKDGYSYVYVHRNVPQRMTLWHSGKTILTSPGNTGIPSAPTVLGTFPVFEHLAETTMAGTNPDGSTYNDPGVKWVSYFNGGDALHAFPRASFGTPQSLGCVELPLDSAAKIWPYTPIGTLVTIEN